MERGIRTFKRMSTCEVKMKVKVRPAPMKKRVLIASLLIPLVVSHVNRHSPDAHTAGAFHPCDRVGGPRPMSDGKG